MNHARVEESTSLEELEIAMAEDLDAPLSETEQTGGPEEDALVEPAGTTFLTELNKNLKELKKGGLGGANSARFEAVTEGIDNISNAFNSYPITGDLMRDEGHARLILELYDSLIKHCDSYIGHRLVLTSAGRARRNQVRLIKQTALKDIKGISQWNLLLLEYPPEMRSTVTWSDLISNNRAEQIHVENFRSLKTMGAGASTNYLVGEGQGLDKLYFFKEELNHTYGKPLKQAWEHILASIEPTEENAALLGVLKGLRDDPEISRVIDQHMGTPMMIPDEVNLELSEEQKPLLPQINDYLIKVGAEMQKKSTQDQLLKVAGYKAGETIN
ncbi:MAG: hypothetical protein GX025_09620, partial [Clostridiales bacterium]|nr:hypothetical protein [Clostridiales bacterium]